jgi:hypothetical protein
MKQLKIAAAAALLALAATASVAAQIHESEDKVADDILRTAIAGSFLEIKCYVPEIQPAVANLTSSASTDSDELIETFFGSEEQIMSTDDIVSPLWGPGRRYKSGTVIYLTPKGVPEQQAFASAKPVEMVPAYLDVYGHGFIYGNNIPQKPVLATDVKVINELRADISEYYVYDEQEGLAAAEGMVADMMSELTLPGGFQSSVTSLIQQDDLRLYAYRVIPQHVTTFRRVIGHETDADGNIQPVLGDEQPVAVPVFDRYVKVTLDGDKLLAGMEYFWDDRISVSGTPQRAISAQQAIIKAREKYLEVFDLQPPLVNVSAIRLGYVQDKGSANRLVPAWLFDAAYARQASPEEQVAERVSGISPNLVVIPMPFAVNAITGEVFDLAS